MLILLLVVCNTMHAQEWITDDDFDVKISGKNGVGGIEFIFKLPIIGDRLDIDRKDYKKHIRGGGTSKNWNRNSD